jgi:tetratricopeptide (TPR) repeat protein
MSAMWKEIGDDLRELTIALCVFRRGRNPDRLARYLERDRGAIQKDLDALKDWRLIQVTEDFSDYYPRHDIVRDMVNEALKDDITKHHLKAADLWLEEGKVIGKNGVPTKVEEIQPLLEAGYHLAEAGDAKLLQKDVLFRQFDEQTGLTELALRLGAWLDMILLYEKLIEIEPDERLIAAPRHNLGVFYQARGDLDAALAEFSACLEIKKKLGDELRIAQGLHQIGIVLQLQGEQDKALFKFKASLDIFVRLGHERGKAQSRHQIGRVYQEKGELDTALTEYKASLKLCEQLGDLYGISLCRHQIGNIYYLNGNMDAALAEYKASLKLCEQLGDISGIATTNGQLGLFYREFGKYLKAFEHSLEAFLVYGRLGEPHVLQVTNDLAILRRIWGAAEFDKAWKEKTGEDVPEEIVRGSEGLGKQE